MKRFAPAKINLSLRVLGRRDDGFHEIETLMVPLSLADEIEIQPLASHRAAAGKFEFVCSDPSLPVGSGNLACRAAELFCARVHCSTDFRLELTKRVPHGAGLGGGSSDAAGVLLALNEFFRAGLGLDDLAVMAAELGSDVPFFVYDSAALCRGRGERVEPVPFSESLPLLLLKPPFPVPTPWAYSRWRDARELPGVRYTPQSFAWGELINDLERPVFEKYLLLAEIKSWLLEQPAVCGALLSGSGSTLFAVLRAADEAEALAGDAKARFGELWTCACHAGENEQ